MKKGYKQTEIGIIPEDWQIKSVGSLCDCIVPGRNKPRLFNGDIPWITTPDIKGNKVSTSKLNLFISKEEAKKVCSRIVPKNSIIISCVGDFGIVTMAETNIVINQQLHAFLPSNLLNQNYLLYSLINQKQYMENIATKTAVPYMNKENCNSIPIPLPPLPEQTAIAEALSDTDELLTTLEKLIEKKKLIKKGTMQELLTGKTRLPGFNTYSKDAMHRVSTGVSTTIPRGYRQTEVGLIPVDWEVKSVGDVITFQGGSQPPLTTFRPVYKEGYIRLLQIRDYKTNKYETYIPKNLARRFCNKEDIMIGRYGPPIFQILKGLEGAYNVALLKAIPTDKIVKEYAYYFLKQDIIFNFVEKLSQRSSGQTGVDLPQLKSYPLGLPSVSEQTAIAETLSDMDSEIEMLEKKLEKTKQIKQGMMQELLTGRIRIV